MSETDACENTDRLLWHEFEGDSTVFVTKSDGIGINCGGHVIVKSLREWHALASRAARARNPAVEAAAKAMWEASPHHPNWTWDDCHPKHDQEYWRRLARIAVSSAVAQERAEKDEAYRQRNHLVAALARLFPSGIARTDIPGWSADWHGCCYIDLPSGQISYHYHDSHAHLFSELPPYTRGWDGHDKDAVHARLAALRARRETTVLDDDMGRLIDGVATLMAAVRREERERCISDVANMTITVSGTDMTCSETKHAAVAVLRARETDGQ